MPDRWIAAFRKSALPEIRRRFRPTSILLFGSRARGAARRDSDIDVIVIASSFRRIPFLKRMPRMLKTAPFARHVDYLCYTPAEFAIVKEQSAVIMDALEHAVELTSDSLT